MVTLSLPTPAQSLAWLERDARRQFWALQLLGWGGMFVVAQLSLGLWYGGEGWHYAPHVLLQAAVGLLLTLPLHVFFSHIWALASWQRLLLGVPALVLAALAWSGVQFFALSRLLPSVDYRANGVAWFLAAFALLAGWSAMYHGARFYQMLQLEMHRSRQSADAERDESLQLAQAQAVAREAQLKMLRYQINPHFLFNTLNAIGALVRFGDNDRAHQMIVQLSQFLRYSLDSNPQHLITLAQEIDAVMLYLAIEKTRFEERLNLAFDVTPEAARGRVPSLLLQPLLENSVKYAIAPSEEGGTIALSARVVAGELIIALTDSGAARATRPASRGDAGRPIGLNNVLERLKTLYPGAYDFSIEMLDPSGLRVTIRIPWDPEDALVTAEEATR